MKFGEKYYSNLGTMTMFKGIMFVYFIFLSTYSLGEEKKVIHAIAKPTVIVQTNKGSFTLELYPNRAPKTVKNFLHYVNTKFYQNTLFHRVIDKFMIQGGGFTTTMVKKSTFSPIKNEANNGLKNIRGSLSMARTASPHSATSQFFINHKDNSFLNYTNSNHGYAVFGRVISGMDTVDKIALVEKDKRDNPIEKVIILSMTIAK